MKTDFLNRMNNDIQNHYVIEAIRKKETWAYEVNPLLKFFSTIILLLMTNYLFSSLESYGYVLLVCVLYSILGRFPLKKLGKMLLVFGFLFPLVFSFQLLFITEGSVLYTFNLGSKTIPIYEAGFNQAMTIILRVLSSIFINGRECEN